MISNKNLKKIKFGILFGCLFYFIFSSQIHIPLIDIRNDKTESKVKTSLDPIHDLTGTTIYIDNTDPSNNWSVFQATYAWCTGDGSSTDPYNIPQVLIDGPYSNLITIKNSDVYFSITWCDLLNGDIGIYLDNVINGEILNNDCSGDSYGIYLTDSHNNTVSNNDFRDSNAGISTSYCSYNEIYSNNFLECYVGIRISDSFNNTVNKNIISASLEYGIWLDGSSSTDITRNVIDDTILRAIYCDDHSSFKISNYNYIAHNKISDTQFGVYFRYNSKYNTVYNNTIYDMTNENSCGVHSEGRYNNISKNIIEHCYNGICVYADFNTISDNIIDIANENGILLEDCSDFNVKGNVITNVSEFGINLINSESGNVLENLLHNCGLNVDGNPSLMSNLNLDDSNQVNNKPVSFYEGITGLDNGDIINAGQIILYSCDDIDFSNLNLNHCSLGMALYNCDLTSISDSDFTYNNHSGIKIISSNHTTIRNINALNNGNGIFIETSRFSNISGNIVNYNSIGGIFLFGSSQNSISDNTASYNGNFGIKLIGSSNDNIISKNTLTSNRISNTDYDYSPTGIAIYGCTGNFISENTIKDHTYSLHTISSDDTITTNTLYDTIWLSGNYNTTLSKNLLYGSSNYYDSIILYGIHSCTIIENTLNFFAGFDIKYNSDNNSFIGNVLNDPMIAFNFEDSSYNKVINNSIYRAHQCFREIGNCIGNVFEGNYCQEGIDLPLDIIGALIGSVAVAGVAIFMYLKRRKYMR